MEFEEDVEALYGHLADLIVLQVEHLEIASCSYSETDSTEIATAEANLVQFYPHDPRFLNEHPDPFGYLVHVPKITFWNDQLSESDDIVVSEIVENEAKEVIRHWNFGEDKSLYPFEFKSSNLTG